MALIYRGGRPQYDERYASEFEGMAVQRRKDRPRPQRTENVVQVNYNLNVTNVYSQAPPHCCAFGYPTPQPTYYDRGYGMARNSANVPARVGYWQEGDGWHELPFTRVEETEWEYPDSYEQDRRHRSVDDRPPTPYYPDSSEGRGYNPEPAYMAKPGPLSIIKSLFGKGDRYSDSSSGSTVYPARESSSDASQAAWATTRRPRTPTRARALQHYEDDRSAVSYECNCGHIPHLPGCDLYEVPRKRNRLRHRRSRDTEGW